MQKFCFGEQHFSESLHSAAHYTVYDITGTLEQEFGERLDRHYSTQKQYEHRKGIWKDGIEEFAPYQMV